MKTDRELDGILDEIGREHRAVAAPRSVEAALRMAAEGRTSARGWRPVWAWAMVMIVAIGLSGVGWKMRRGHALHDEQADVVVTRPVPAKAVSVVQGKGESSQVVSSVDPRRSSVPLRSASVGRAHVQEVSLRRTGGDSLQDFVPLPVSEGLPPAAELSVVRVKMLGSDLQQYGLQAPVDGAVRSLLAEFVVGEDGLPRAIRIIQ